MNGIYLLRHLMVSDAKQSFLLQTGGLDETAPKVRLAGWSHDRGGD